MENVICRNCYAQVEIPDYTLEIKCPNCGNVVRSRTRTELDLPGNAVQNSEPEQNWEQEQTPDPDQEEKDRERIRRIAEAAAAEERLRIAKERENREKTEGNRKTRKTYLLSVAAMMGVALLCVLVAAAENLDGSLPMFLGAALGALAVEVVAFAVTFLLSLWAFSARINNKGGKTAALVLTRIAAVLGMIIWALVGVVGLTSMEGEAMMGLWGLANMVMHLLAFIMPGRIKVEKN